ncbi:MAG: quinoprotein glucose dehydrogenase [Candidatus Latescibacterota bacterium]
MYNAFFALTLVLYTIPTYAQDLDWRYYASDAGSSKYAPLAQIDRDNFKDLRVVWRYKAPDEAIATTHGLGYNNNRGTPIKIGDVLYYGSPYNILCAIDARSGEELWTFDPGSWRERGNFLGNLRGITYWSDGEVERIFFGTSTDRLYSIDARTGQPDPDFGLGGYVDLMKGSDRPLDPDMTGVTSPPIVCDGVVAVGSAMNDWRYRSPPDYTPPGDVRGFDARTGELRWTFHTIPREGEYGVETWENDAYKRFGAANVWAAMSADDELGYIYLPVSTPSHDFYGGERPGDNLFGDSLVCLKASTGERVWHYQLIHHGLWDYDPPAPPVLMDVVVDGQPRKIVAQVTKQAFCYVFDRATGEPIWPIIEKSVPESSADGEKAAPTQPFPSKPAAFDLQGITDDDLIDFTPVLKEKARQILALIDHGPLYTPPSERGTLLVPGLIGGADWAGAAAHPGKGVLYVPSHTIPSIVQLAAPRRGNASSAYAGRTRDRMRGPEGLPLTKPPYGRITAIDLNTGEHLWVQATGRGPVDHPALAHLDLPDLGWGNRSFVMATSTLLLAAFQNPHEDGGRRGWDRRGGGWIDREAVLRAYDLDTGALIGEVELPDNAYGNPMTYMAGGRQYIVVPLGNNERAPELVGLALPQ